MSREPFESMSDVMDAKQLAQALQIFKAGAYNLLNDQDFPTLRIDGQTHNTDLKKRLTTFATKFPECRRQIDDDEQGGLTFEIEKDRLSFRLTAFVQRGTKTGSE